VKAQHKWRMRASLAAVWRMTRLLKLKINAVAGGVIVNVSRICYVPQTQFIGR
jgi:hypothetical protein